MAARSHLHGCLRERQAATPRVVQHVFVRHHMTVQWTTFRRSSRWISTACPSSLRWSATFRGTSSPPPRKFRWGSVFRDVFLEDSRRRRRRLRGTKLAAADTSSSLLFPEVSHSFRSGIVHTRVRVGRSVGTRVGTIACACLNVCVCVRARARAWAREQASCRYIFILVAKVQRAALFAASEVWSFSVIEPRFRPTSKRRAVRRR